MVKEYCNTKDFLRCTPLAPLKGRDGERSELEGGAYKTPQSRAKRVPAPLLGEPRMGAVQFIFCPQHNRLCKPMD